MSADHQTSHAALPSGVQNHIPAGVQRFTPSSPLHLRSGEQLREAVIAYQSWGSLNAAGDNVIWVCHALTGTSDVENWWPALFGPGRALDPDQYFIVCANVLGGCYGSAGPLTHGAGSFPTISISDIVAHQRQLAEYLGIRSIALMLGGSMGGFQALEWLVQAPHKVRKLALVACADSQPAQAIALSHLQMQQVIRDPLYQAGFYGDAPPLEGLSLARQIGHLSYRCDTELGARFAREQRDDGVYQVLSYLQHQGSKLVRRFDANSYLRLNQAMIDFSVVEHRAQLNAFPGDVLVVGIDSDWLYPWHEQVKLADYFPHGRSIRIHSDFGHDGFLLDAERFEPALRALLGQSTELLACA
jgi:homoserine O-acetyltransferase/O-succinyltransferase